MFNFLNPTVLFALAAGLIPLIIHLLNRRKIKEIRFSTIHFLKQMARKEMRRLRIRQILLLLIRTLIILLLVATFARPTLRSSGGFLAGRATTEAVIIIDNSLSLNSLELTGNLLEKIRQQWINLEPAFQSGDRISVILGVNPLKVLADRETYSPALWEKIAKQIQPGYSTGNMNQAIFKALDVLHNSDIFNQELYILSDFQQSGFQPKELASLKENWDKRIKLFCLPVFHKPEENISIDTAAVANRLIEKNQTLKIDATAANRNPDSHLSALLSLVIGGNRVGQQNVSIASRERKPIVFETTLQSTGFISGYVESESDALLEDNRYYFNFFVPQNVQVLHLLPGHQFRSYIPLILKPAIDRNLFVYQSRFAEDWASIDFMKYKAIILEGIDRIPEGLAERLTQFTQRGNGLLIIPGGNMVSGEMNNLLKNLDMGQILDREGKPGGNGEFITMGKVNWQHPIFEGLFEDRKELNPVTFQSFYKIKPSPRNEVIIRMRNGEPLLVGGGQKSGSAYLLATPLQPEWTNLVVRGFVVPLIYRLLYYTVTRSVQERTSLTVGQPFSQVFRQLQPPYEFSLLRPSGVEEKISPVFKGSDLLLRVEQNPEPGNYEIRQGQQLIGMYSVNHSPLESEQKYYQKSDLEGFVPELKWIPLDADLVQSIETSRFGRELWPYFLGLAFLLLLLEMGLGYTGSRRQARQMQRELAET